MDAPATSTTLTDLFPLSLQPLIDDHWTYPERDKNLALDPQDDDDSHRPHLLVSLSSKELRSWKKAYEQDVYYKDKGQEHSDASTLLTPSHFQRSGNGLMYLVDANWRYTCASRRIRLCELFYWPRLVKDATDFMASCDVCQKIKVDRRGKQGGLRPSHIPARPFSTISMDMITGLPESGPEKFTAVLAFIDKLTKSPTSPTTRPRRPDLSPRTTGRTFNCNHRPVDLLEPGDLVLVNPHTLQLIEASGTGRKLVQRMIGPFEVMHRINPLVYRLRLPTNYPMHPIVNLSHLKCYTPSDACFGTRETLPSTRDILPATEEWEVERILGHRITSTRKGKAGQYLVRWKGLDAVEDSWLNEFDLRNAPELQRDYDVLVNKNLSEDSRTHATKGVGTSTLSSCHQLLNTLYVSPVNSLPSTYEFPPNGNDQSRPSSALYQPSPPITSSVWRLQFRDHREASPYDLFTLLHFIDQHIKIVVLTVIRTWNNDRPVYWVRFKDSSQALVARGFAVDAEGQFSMKVTGALVSLELIRQAEEEEYNSPAVTPLEINRWNNPLQMFTTPSPTPVESLSNSPSVVTTTQPQRTLQECIQHATLLKRIALK
ncbi:Integrase catalytic domain-containing protein [Salix suchowensis]|nr:Integrase catalytic domain-containing protein [Salix suchowensis]